ncbi:MAG: hypothetical protein ABIQ40_12110 [Bacteroidia bacterium]
MKNQGKSNQQTPQDAAQKPTPSIPNENQRQAPQNVPDKNKKEQKMNPGGKEQSIGDFEKNEKKNQTGDNKKIKDPDPTKPEKRNDPVAGKNKDYARTLNTPGKTDSNKNGEFTETDELDSAEEEEEETSNISDEEEDEDEPGSFEPEKGQKEAFSGERKNSNTIDERKNKNGL